VDERFIVGKGAAKSEDVSFFHQLDRISGVELASSLNCKRVRVDEFCSGVLDMDNDRTRLPYTPVLDVRGKGLTVWASADVMAACPLNAETIDSVAMSRIIVFVVMAFADVDLGRLLIVIMRTACVFIPMFLLLSGKHR